MPTPPTSTLIQPTRIQLQRVQNAMLDAFDHASLSQLTRLHLELDLEWITPVAGKRDLTTIVHDLVIYFASQDNGLKHLLTSAIEANPGNLSLQTLKTEWFDFEFEPIKLPEDHPAVVSIDSDGGAIVDGNIRVDDDFIGRDKVHIENFEQVIYQQAPPRLASGPLDEEPTPGEPPYKGLQYFDEDDADLFFGRDALTARLVQHLGEHRFLAVVGASGSGKSSVVLAGLIPALKQDKPLAGGIRPQHDSSDWPVHVITPTAHPLKELAATLTKDSLSVQATSTLIDDLANDKRSLDLTVRRILNQSSANRLLLVVDQFEELFTLCRDESERLAFVDNLLTAAALEEDGPTYVVLTLRADFYAQCAEFDVLREALENRQKYIGPMTPDELRSAIEEPAQQNGWSFESGLVDLLLQDVGEEPGALPLLSHALLETWKRREGHTLTFEGYTASGRIQGAIAKTAEGVFNRLSAEQQLVARNIFLRLTELGEGAQDTRRRIELDDLVPNPANKLVVEDVLTTLTNARLVTTTQNEAEVAHEALIREWPMLRKWLDESRDGLRTHRRLAEAALLWETLNLDSGVLYRGAPLDQALAWKDEHPNELSDLDRQFLDASVSERERQADERNRLQREREAARESELKQAKIARNRARLAALASIATALLLIIIGIFGYSSYQEYRTVANATLLVNEANQLTKNLQAEAAIAKFEEAHAQYPQLGLNLEAEIAEVKRTVAISLTRQGEELLRTAQNSGESDLWSGNFISATALFSQAFALEPPPDASVYVKIPAGEFLMGSDASDSLAMSDETPQHPVHVDEFWMRRTEVTNGQYKSCIEAEVCTPPLKGIWDKPDYAHWPVTNVSWEQSQTYARWVGGRLPTEAEWEKACRGEGGWIYPWGNTSPTADYLNYDYNNGGAVSVGLYAQGNHGSGSIKPNDLLDMAGNVWEWTLDWHDDDYYAISPSTNPYGPDTGRVRTIRGGSFWNVNDRVRCAARVPSLPDKGYVETGFRVIIAKSPVVPTNADGPEARFAGGTSETPTEVELEHGSSLVSQLPAFSEQDSTQFGKAQLHPIKRDEFVIRQEHQLILANDPFRFLGTVEKLLQQQMVYGEGEKVLETLDTAAALGVSVMRIWAFNDREDDSAAIQTEPGIYIEESLVALDQVIAEAKERDIRLILTLTSNWTNFGGLPRYVEWCDCGASHVDFFTDDTIKGWYRDYVTMLINRTNTVTGISYKDEPAILAWELGNGLRSPGSNASNLLAWQEEMAAHIKSLDPNHLVADGGEGFDNAPEFYAELSNLYAVRGEEGAAYHRLLKLPSIDMVSYQLYPHHWGLDNLTDPEVWVHRHEMLARREGKVAYLAEAGTNATGLERAITYHRWLTMALAETGSSGALVTGIDFDRLEADEGSTIHCTKDVETCGVLRYHAANLYNEFKQ